MKLLQLLFRNPRRLKLMVGKLKGKEGSVAAQSAIDQTKDIISQMEIVLAEMVELESFKELLDFVRTLIDEQEKLMKKTENEQSRSLIDLLK